MKTALKVGRDDELTALRAAMAGGRRGRGYRGEVRDAVIRYAERAIAGGATQTALARQLGVHPVTLSLWLKKMLADRLLEIEVMKEIAAKKW